MIRTWFQCDNNQKIHPQCLSNYLCEKFSGSDRINRATRDWVEGVELTAENVPSPALQSSVHTTNLFFLKLFVVGFDPCIPRRAGN